LVAKSEHDRLLLGRWISINVADDLNALILGSSDENDFLGGANWSICRMSELVNEFLMDFMNATAIFANEKLHSSRVDGKVCHSNAIVCQAGVNK